MRDALKLAINRVVKGADGNPTKRLNVIAEQLAAKAEAGEQWAVSEVFDRIDGRAHQTADINVISRKAAELLDDELADIASGSGEGASAPESNPPVIN